VRSLLLASSFPPAVGGVETLLYQTARRLSSPPLVVVPGAGPRPPDVPTLAVRNTVYSRAVYRPTWLAHPSLYYLAALWQPALAAAREWRPRVIQVGHVSLAPLGWLLARRLRRPWVVYAYGQEVWRAGRPLGPLDGLMRAQPLRAADAILSLGTFTTSLLADWQVRPERVTNVPYGADPRPRGSAPCANTLLSVARLVPRKGIDQVIRALPRLPGVEYRVVGSGPDQQRLRTLARSAGVVDRVHLLGRVDDATLADEYQRCAVFVLPARRTRVELEGYGLVYFEAAAWGRPVVAGRSGGEVDAVVEGETGALVDGTSVAAIAQTLRDLLADPDRLRALGEAGRRRVESTHNWTTAAGVIQGVLERLA